MKKILLNFATWLINKLTGVPYSPFPISFHTVDIIATREVNGVVEILLGRKPKSDKWVFIGGFVEPTHTAEHTASKELGEETHIEITDESRFEYLGSAFINDSRYVNSCHKITTSLFTVKLTPEEQTMAKGGDDIEEVKFVPISEVLGMLKTHHRELFRIFVNKKLAL